MLRHTLIICMMVMLTVSGCRGKYLDRDNFFAPRPAGMGKPKAGAHPDYTAGWDDGCETGLSTMVHGYYKLFYGYKQDEKMLNNKRYYQAWKDAYTYCRHYSFRWAWDGFDNTSAQKYDNPLCILCDNETTR